MSYLCIRDKKQEVKQTPWQDNRLKMVKGYDKARIYKQDKG